MKRTISFSRNDLSYLILQHQLVTVCAKCFAWTILSLTPAILSQKRFVGWKDLNCQGVGWLGGRHEMVMGGLFLSFYLVMSPHHSDQLSQSLSGRSLSWLAWVGWWFGRRTSPAMGGKVKPSISHQLYTRPSNPSEMLYATHAYRIGHRLNVINSTFWYFVMMFYAILIRARWIWSKGIKLLVTCIPM